MPQTPTTRIAIPLPDNLYEAYERMAVETRMDIEDLLAKRLAAATTHDAAKPIYFNDAERQQLEQMLGKNVSSARDVLSLVRNCVAVRINGLKITLKPSLLSRLKTRCLGMQWDKFLEKIIVEDLERYVGVR